MWGWGDLSDYTSNIWALYRVCIIQVIFEHSVYVLHLNRVICLNDCTLEPWVSQLLLLPFTCIVSTSGLRPLLQLETLLSTVGWQSLYHNHNQIEKFKLFPILRLKPLCFSMGQYSLGDPLSLVTKRRYKLLRDVIRGHHFPFCQQRCQKESLEEETVFPVDWKDILLCVTHSSFEYLKHWASSQGPRPKISLLKEFCSQI